MKITIEINCEDEKDAFLHLTVIRGQIRAKFKENENEDKFLIEDSSIYGNHTVTVVKGKTK